MSQISVIRKQFFFFYLNYDGFVSGNLDFE